MTGHSPPSRPGGPSRRDFLASSLLLAAPFLAPLAPRRLAASARETLGLQLYTLRDPLKADFDGTLAAVARMGYQEVEFYDGLYDADLGARRALLDRLSLTAPSGHMGIDRLERDPARALADARTLGHRYVIVPWIGRESRSVAGYTELARRLERLAPRFAEAGILLGYHNHDFDLKRLSDGRSGLEVLLDELEPKGVAMELDLYWAKAGGGDPSALFRRYPHHFRLVHIKDMGRDGAQTGVGEGVIDWPSLLAEAKRAGVTHWFAEQDDPKDPLGFAARTQRYLSSISW
jgi:sugar phosphate isomerase/epimerase